MAPTRRGPAPLDRSGETFNLLYRFAIHWPLALVLGLGCATAGFLYAQRYTPIYHSEAQVRVGENLDAKVVPGQREDSSEMVDLPENLAASFRARFLVDPKLLEVLSELANEPALQGFVALQTPAGREALADHIKGHLQVDPVTRRVYRVSYDGPDALFVQRVVQRLSEVGVQEVIEQRGANARQARMFLTAEGEAARRRMVQSEDELVRFVRQNPSLRLGGDKKVGLGIADKLLVSRGPQPAVNPLKELERMALSPEVRSLNARRADLEATAAQIEGAQKIDPLASKLAESERLSQQLAELKAQNYTAEYPEYRRITSDIARIQADLRDYKSRKDKGLAQDFRRLAEVKAELAAVDKQLAAARRRAALAGAPENPIPEERVLSAEATYARLVRDVETYRTAYEKIHDREVEAQINEELSKVKGNLAARVEDPAKRAPGPRGVSRKLMTLICLALGFLAGALIALVRSLTDPHIYTVFDLARASKLPVLGRVPRRDGSGGSALSDVSEEVGQSGNSVRLELPPDPSGPGRLALERERSGISMSPLATGAHSSISSLPGGGSPSSVSSLGQAAPVPPRSGSPVTQPLPTLGGVPQPASGSDASGRGEWGSDYMVVYSSGREGTHPGRDLSGLRSASELAPGNGDWGDGSGRVNSQMMTGHSSRRSLHLASPQSVGYRLTSMGHTLTPGQMPKDPNLFVVSAPDGARAEQYRLLRCRLQDLGDPRVIVLTSALRGEGKTVAAANLALAYAEGGAHSVVLIDAHLSAPRLTELMGAQGRSEPLRESDVVRGGLQLWQYAPNLFLVPALGPRVKRSAVLSSPAFAMLVADMRQTFEYIIIDAPAVASAADSKLVLRSADVGLFLTKARTTTGKAVEVALDRLGRRALAGVVLNEF